MQKEEKEFHYRSRCFRIGDDIYSEMKKQRGAATWNKYFKKLILKNK